MDHLLKLVQQSQPQVAQYNQRASRSTQGNTQCFRQTLSSTEARQLRVWRGLAFHTLFFGHSVVQELGGEPHAALPLRQEFDNVYAGRK